MAEIAKIKAPEGAEFVIRSAHILWTIIIVLAGLLWNSFNGGMYIQKTYVTAIDLKAAMEQMHTELTAERVYEREQHETMGKEYRSYSDNNHTDAILKIANVATDQKLLGQKMETMIEVLKDIQSKLEKKK